MEKFKERVFLATPTMHGEEKKYIREAFETNWIAPLGPNVDAFEKAVREYLDIDGTCAVISGTSALHLAYKLADINQGDIVLVSDLTFSATLNPIIYQNATPVLIDSERETWNMDPRALKLALEKYKDRVKAVVAVHLYGIPSKMDEIKKLCDEYNVTFIEDAAESLSATYKGKQTGTFGKFAGISFNGNKLVTSSGGGMLLAQKKEHADKARFWATQSKDPAPWYQHSELGYNYRMSNIVAGVGRGQFLHIEEHKKLKTDIYFNYKKLLNDIDITMNPYLEESVPSFWLSCMLIGEDSIKNGVDPEKIRLHLEEYNVESRRIWKPMHLQPFFEKYDYIKYEDESVSEDIFNRGLCLPSDIKMTIETQQKVCELIKNVF